MGGGGGDEGAKVMEREGETGKGRGRGLERREGRWKGGRKKQEGRGEV